MTDKLVEEMATRIQLWWMTQKHEPMHQNDAHDLGQAAATISNKRIAELEEALDVLGAAIGQEGMAQLGIEQEMLAVQCARAALNTKETDRGE